MIKKTTRFGLFIVLVVFSAVSVWAGAGKEKGRDVTLGNFWADWDANTYIPQDEIGEMTVDWRKRIQQEHGFTMRERMVSNWDNMLQTITASVMAGRPAAHALIVEPGWAMALHRQRLLAPLSDSNAINLKNTMPIAYKQVGYNQDVGNLFTFNGKTYAMAIGYGNSRHGTGIFFNKRIFIEAGLDPDLPYDLQKAGTWTWDKFFEISRAVTRDRNNTGIIDTYALPSDHSKLVLDAFVFSNGANFVARDASGNFVNATQRQEFIEALQFCERLMDEGVMKMRPDGSNWDWYFSAFHDGQLAMMIEHENSSGSLRNMTDDWGFVLPPKGPRASDYRYPTDENVIIVPSTYKGEELDFILTAVDLWHIPVNDDWQAGLWGQFRDTRAVSESLAMIRSPRYGAFRNYMLIPGLEIGEIAWVMWWMNNDPAQLVESVSQSWNALVSEANAIR